MTHYLDAIDFSALDQTTREKCQKVIAPALATLKAAHLQVTVSDKLADIKGFWQANHDAEGLIRLTAFDNQFHPDGNCRGIFLETAGGRRIGTVWNKRFPLRVPDGVPGARRQLTLKQAFEDLYIYYHDPGVSPKRETCQVTCEIAEDIKRGTISYRGAYFIHPDYQRKGLARPLSLLARVLSLTSPEPFDWFVLISNDKDRMRMIELFPCTGFYRYVKHGGIDWWLGISTYAEMFRDTLDEVV